MQKWDAFVRFGLLRTMTTKIDVSLCPDSTETYLPDHAQRISTLQWVRKKKKEGVSVDGKIILKWELNSVKGRGHESV
jgi:hypothetical protein